MMKHPYTLICFFLFGCVGGQALTQSKKVFNENQIQIAIRSGKLGNEIAERAKKTDNLYIRPLEVPVIPNEIFTFSDFRGGYTALVENDHMILLCSGWGGGYAHDFRIAEESGKKVLTYEFEIGSGISHFFYGKYILGSGKTPFISSLPKK